MYLESIGIYLGRTSIGVGAPFDINKALGVTIFLMKVVLELNAADSPVAIATTTE